ncbi:MAG: M64 family metallopeptidase, partial [Rikenellaceae bacterium]
DRFNVYAVKAISKNEGVNGVSETIFSAEFTGGTAISGDNTKVFTYALKVPSISSTSNLTVIAVLNSSNYAGTCSMYSSGASVAYCPIVNNNDEAFRQVIIHEAGGHGFGKLMDEYASDNSGTITSSRISTFNWEVSLGWGANTDITNDASQIRWAHFLEDSRYSGLVGIYEGALTYEYGAYRPTDVSIMRYNTGGYNAPSREEIYRRIMIQSGEEYDFEEFVAYDAINLSVSSQTYSAVQAANLDKSTFVPLASPVVILGSPELSR